MPNYDFLNLSPAEFEELSRDLLQEQLEITLESFTTGKDKGIDFRYTIARGSNLIAQCKRFRDYESLLPGLKKEARKVQLLHPDRYIVVTSVGLTPVQKDSIVRLFAPYILDTSDIFGKDDINNLLGLYPDIERRHFKLWLSSTNILEQILHNDIYNQSVFELESIKQTINVYVDNESFFKANEIIKEKRYVIISGIPGIGKTTLARILVYHYLASGFEQFIFLSGSIDEGYTLYKEGVRQIFLFDDFLGTNFLENKLRNNEEHRIVRFVEKISCSKDKVIILTTREYILAQAKQKYDVFNSAALEFAKCIIDLSQYTKIVRAKILYNHLFFSDLPPEHVTNLVESGLYKNIIDHPNYSPRNIQVITKEELWKTIQPADFPQKFLEFISDPNSIWKHVYENQIARLSQCMLAILMTAGTPILLDDLKIATQAFAKKHGVKYGILYSEIEYKKSIRELENTFIQINKDAKAQFFITYQNPSVQDFLVNYLSDSLDMMKDIFASAAFFNQYFEVFAYKEVDLISTDKKILLGKDETKIVIDMIIAEFDFLNSSALRGQIYTGLKKAIFSDYTKLWELSHWFDLSQFSVLTSFIKERFAAIVEPTDLTSEELAYYIELLGRFGTQLELNRYTILEQFSENIITMRQIDEFEKFKRLFPDEYQEFTLNDEGFLSRVQQILFSEAEDTEYDFEESLSEINRVADKFGLEMQEIEEIIERKRDEQAQQDNNYDWDAISERHSSTPAQDDNKAIDNMFESLIGGHTA